MKNILIMILTVSLMFAACTTTTSPTGKVTGGISDKPIENTGTVSFSAVDLASDFVKNTETYQYDGSKIKLVDSQKNDDEKTYVFEYTTENTGYGDRTNKEVMNVDRTHEVVVMVDNKKVVSAITDDYWDEISNDVKNEGYVLMRYQPVQCEDNPWDLWYDYNAAVGPDEFDKPVDVDLIERYYNKIAGAKVLEVNKEFVSGNTCQACGQCKTPHYYTIKINTGYQASQLEEEGWDYVSPLSKLEAQNYARDWIRNTDTYKHNNGRKIELVVVNVDKHSPQRIIATFGFETIDGGYGKNSVMSADGINYHVIKLTIENGIITDALVDNRWDEINNKLE